MGIETFYRINCDACDAHDETTDSRSSDIKKFELDFNPPSMRPGKPRWSGWLCRKCADGLRTKMREAVANMGGEHG